MNLIKALTASASLAALTSLNAQVLIAFWDFNDETAAYVNTPLSFVPDSGAQSTTASLDMVLADTGSAQTYGVRAEGTTVNDLLNDPQVAGNSFSFSRGTRSNGASATVRFDAASISNDVILSFAINRIVANGVNSYQASYSIDGGLNYTNFGTSVSIIQGSWELNSINFGTVLAGEADARVRLTFAGGVQNWSTDHRTNLDNIALSAVPEPSTYAALLGALALGVAAWRRRR